MKIKIQFLPIVKFRQDEVMKKLLLVSAISLTAFAAQAQIYGEVGYVSTTIKDTNEGFTIKASPTAIRGMLGYELNPNLAVEGMAAFGLSDASIKVNGQSIPGVNFTIDHAVGIYLKPKLKLNDAVEIFGRVGYARVKGTVSVPAEGSESNTESSASYGAGLSYAINPKLSLNADYMQYLSKGGTKINGFAFGLGFKF